ncbi:HAD family hydrolase [Arhodomonas sp. KWT2]
MSLQLAAPVTAVTFDLDYTLWDLAGVIEHAEEVAYAYLDANYPAVTAALSPEAVLALRSEVVADRPEIAHDVSAMRREAFRRAGTRAGYSAAEVETLVEDTFHVFVDARHDIVLFDDAVPVLEWLRARGVRLGALTNGNADIRRLRMDGYFDFALAAVDVGAAKPSHLVFEAARGHAGVSMGEIVHVGDDPHSDVIGAAAAGMQPV